MNKGLIAFLGFSCGGVAGFFAGKKLLEQHYNQVIQEEIDSVKRAFRRQVKSMSDAKPKTAKEIADTPKENPVAETDRGIKTRSDDKKTDYRAFYPNKKAAVPKKEEPKEEEKTSHYVIPPEEFGTNAGYEEISLTYYSDGTIADDDDNAMSEEDIEETIGRESLKHFGEYEPDSVFVRNDDMRTDYEILQDERSYEEAMNNKAYRAPNQ